MNREAFEANYASSHDLPLETFSQYRMGDTYRLPGIASHWRTWLSASGKLEKIAEDRKACWEEFKVQGRQLDKLKAESESLRLMLVEIRDSGAWFHTALELNSSNGQELKAKIEKLVGRDDEV